MTKDPSGGDHRRSLDGLRAFAIIGVMLVHAGVPGARSGWVGVDLFFVLSGFLITTLLMEEAQRHGKINWPAFMARRALRLMPAYALYALLVTVLMWWAPGSVRSSHGGWSPEGLTAALWTYTINFAPMGGIWNGQELTIHLWSLAVEQQYYLVWPICVLLCVGRSLRLVATGVACTLAFLAMFVLATPGIDENAMLFTRGFSLTLASTAAVIAFGCMSQPGEHRYRTADRWIGVTGGLALLGLLTAPYLTTWPEDEIRRFWLPLVVPVFGWWIVRLWYAKSTSIVRRLLQSRPLVYIGKISYGIYLYHEAVRVGVWSVAKPMMAAWPGSVGFVARVLLYFAVSVLVAGLSYRFIEQPCLRLSARFRPSRSQIGHSDGDPANLGRQGAH